KGRRSRLLLLFLFRRLPVCGSFPHACRLEQGAPTVEARLCNGKELVHSSSWCFCCGTHDGSPFRSLEPSKRAPLMSRLTSHQTSSRVRLGSHDKPRNQCGNLSKLTEKESHDFHCRQVGVFRRFFIIEDDDPQVTSALGSVFEPEQWAILHAPDNREALKLAEARAFDLIITGAKSTGKEDIDLLRKIRRVRPHVRLIILTDASTPTDVIAAMRERAFSYFSKPFSTASLAEIVRCAATEPFWDDGIELVSATPEWISI